MRCVPAPDEFEHMEKDHRGISFNDIAFFKIPKNTNVIATVIVFLCLAVGFFFGREFNTTPAEKFIAVVMPETPNMNLKWENHPDYGNIELVRYPYLSPQENVQFRIPVNKGFEAMIYLTYIIQFYDNLPAKVLFVHGHSESWHQEIPLDDLLVMISWKNVHGYINLQACGYDLDTGIVGSAKTIVLRAGDQQHNILREFWKEFDMVGRYDFPVIDDLTIVEGYCCGQFLVDRQTVHRHTKEFYIDLRQWLLDTKWSDVDSSKLFTHLWHIIFTGQFRNFVPLTQCHNLFEWESNAPDMAEVIDMPGADAIP